MNRSYTVKSPDFDADRELDRLYSSIAGRPQFSYDAGSDPLYRAEAQRYRQNGRMAMRHSAGQTAALTGGYASSYSQTAGQQQYGEYLRSLSEIMPEFYDRAYRRYADEGERMQSAYDMAYQKNRDDKAAAAAAEKQSYDRRKDSYRNLVSLIESSGYNPSDRELSDSGLTRAQADALINKYKMDNGLLEPAAPKYIYVNGGRKKKSRRADRKFNSGLPPKTRNPVMVR